MMANMEKYYTGELSVTDEVYNRIMSMIADGVWKEGDKLPSEKMLCERFSVSRVSVRAAIQRLKGQGFISTRHSVGSFVVTPAQSPILGVETASDITGDDYLQLFELRQAIEMRVIDLFVVRATEEERERVERAVCGMLEHTDDVREFTEWDIAFHEAIYQGAHNKYLLNVFLAYKELFFHYLEEINRLSSITLKDMAANHRFLCDNLLNNNPEAVKKRILADNSRYYATVFKHIV